MSNESEIKQLKDLKLAGENFGIIIGAGITSKIIGQWNEMLNDLFVQKCFSESMSSGATKYTYRDFIEYLKSSGLPEATDSREKGEYLRYSPYEDCALTGDIEEERELIFSLRVQQAMEEIMKEKTGNASFQELINGITEDDLKKNYGTLWAVLCLCLKRKPQCVITYNFDTIFDRLLSKKALQDMVGCEKVIRIHTFNSPDPVELELYKDDEMLWNAASDKPVIDVYHVHGILDSTITHPDSIIFSGTSYDCYQENQLNRSTRVIMDALDQCKSILCIGFSGEDTNFRNIMENYARLCKSPLFRGEPCKVHICSAEAEIQKSLKLKDEDDEIQKEIVSSYKKMKSQYYRHKYGITIQWSDDFDKMAEEIFQLC